jgi:hypothetical protein
VPAGGLSNQESQGDNSEPSGNEGGSPSESFSANALTFVQMTTAKDSTLAVATRDLRGEYGLDIAVGMSPDGLLCR